LDKSVFVLIETSTSPSLQGGTTKQSTANNSSRLTEGEQPWRPEKIAMSRLIRSLSDDSVAGHVEVEMREESRQSGLIRRRSRDLVSDAG
jgi:hypothetical protein